MSFFTDDTVFILDSYGLIYREYFAFISRPLTNAQGQNISALFGFFRNLTIILKKYKPRYMVAAFDSRTPTFRHQMYDQYKATRAKTPDDLKAQFPWIEDMLGRLGIPVVRVDGFEADDVIATIASECEKQGRHAVVLSGDKDLMQLVSDKVHMMKPDKAEAWKEIDAAGVVSEWGVGPEKMLDVLSLIGDTADNVPGVKGIGGKTAVKLLEEYGSLEGIYERADEIKGAMGEKIRTGKDDAFFSQKLIRLRYDVPCVTDLNSFSTTDLHFAEAAAAMTRWTIPSIAKSWMEMAKGSSASGSAEASPRDEFLPARAGSGAGAASDAAPQIPAAPAQEILEVKENHGDYRAVQNLAELKAYVDEILAKPDATAAFDTETDSLDTLKANLVGFSLSHTKGSGIYVPLILTDSLLAGPLISKRDALAELSRLFGAEKCTLVMHNAKFDLEVLWSNGFGNLTGQEEINYRCSLADTMIAAWLLESDRLGKNAYGLEYLAETKLGLKGIEYEAIVPKNATFADVPIEEAAKYGAEDSDFTLQLWQRFEGELKSQNLYELFASMEMKVLPLLARMEMRGIHLDRSALTSYQGELQAQLTKTEKEIYELVGHEFNIASPLQLQKVLFEERGLKPGKKTKRGYSTDTSVLEELAWEDPVPQKILEYRNLAKLLSTYVETLPALADENSRIHTSFMQTGTATGRLSSRDPNLQNIPVRDEAGRKIRSAFTAEEGTILISADYAQIELVVLAHLSGDKNMCQAFIDGVDVHKATASLIYAVPPEAVTAEMRRSAKTINFGVMYGMSAFRLARDLGIPNKRAQDFITNYFATYSGIRSFIDDTVRHAEETGFVQTIAGRKRAILGIRSANKVEKAGAERVATNTPIQGSAADIVKKAMLDVDAALKSHPTGAKLLLQVHDELIFECPDNPQAIDETIAIIRDKMEHAFTLTVPLRVSIEQGKNWGLFH